jgi:predicted CoA-binding protein
MATKVVSRSSNRSAPPSPGRRVDHDAYSDDYLRGILRRVNVIAMVGASPHWNRPSYFAMKYLQHKGYRVIPVNPAAAGQTILGEKAYAGLKDIPERVDMVDVFRNSAAAGPIADEAVAIGAKVLWMQLGVRNDAAAKRAEAAGLQVVMNRCPKIEFGRLCGELSWSGINSGIISARRQKPVR